MGLDITYYETVVPVDYVSSVKDDGMPETPCPHRGEDGERLHIQSFAYAPFARSLIGLDPGRCYEASEPHYFAAGSYTGYNGYNEWRDDLSRLTTGHPAEWIFQHADDFVDEPFFELINFADNEGTIGPVAAMRLAEDFMIHRDTYMLAHSDDVHGWASQKYDEWRDAFVMAAGSGLVEFR